MWCGVRRLVLSRMIVVVVGALGIAAMSANTDPRLLADMHNFKVLPMATIVDSPTTVGLADSNLMRLDSFADIDKELDMMQSIGVQDIRIGLYWAQIEPAEGVFNWTKADYIVNQANARGMGVLTVLNQTPAWAGDPIGAGTPSAEDFSSYATAVTARYKGKISAVEIWNEPNASFFLNPVSPSNYTELLKAGYTAIKAVDPSITVIGGVLGSGQTQVKPDGTVVTMDPYNFLQGMYDAGAQGFFDALSFHPYKYDIKFSNQGLIADSPLNQLKEMRALMDSLGDGAKSIWATEYGLPTVSGGLPITDIDQQKQADFIADFLNSWGEQAGTGPIFIYSTRDIDTGDGEKEDNFGIWETDWTPKLAVQVIQDFIAAQTEPTHPIIDAIKNLIVNGVKFVGQVINGVVDLVVGAVEAVAAAVVWVVATGAKVVVKVANGIGDLIKGVVNKVVSCVEHIFGVGAAATAAAAAKTKGKIKDRADIATAVSPVSASAVSAKKKAATTADAAGVAVAPATKNPKEKKAAVDVDVDVVATGSETDSVVTESAQKSLTDKAGATDAADVTGTSTKADKPEKSRSKARDGGSSSTTADASADAAGGAKSAHGGKKHDGHPSAHAKHAKSASSSRATH